MGCDEGGPAAVHLPEAEVLMAQSNCLGCHEAESSTVARIGLMPGPRLDAVGGRMSPVSMRAFLSDPGEAKPGSPMPSILHGMPSEGQEELIESLVHYLQSLGGPFVADSTKHLPVEIEHGRVLYEQVGCIACHDAGGMGHLASKTSIEAMSTFLQDPLHVRPSGRMPGMQLDAREAVAIATFLLRDQVEPEGLSPRQGLVATMYRIDKPIVPEMLPELEVDHVMAVKNIGLDDLPHPDDFFAIRFMGMIHMPREGRWGFRLTSDDGSWLYIDGEEVVEHGGTHSNTSRENFVQLDKGAHGFELLYFEYTSYEELSMEWRPPGGEWGPVPDVAFSAELATFNPPVDPSFVIDEKMRVEGESIFRKFHCASCHVPGAPSPGLPLASLDPERGCLSANVRPGLPSYGFTDAQRAMLSDLVDGATLLAQAPSPGRSVNHAMERFNCLSCHARDGTGGVSSELDRLLVSEADLGDEGRLPPDLTGVGNKLNEDSIWNVLLEGERIRPFMSVRMPEYGDVLIDLPGHFADADALEGDEVEPAFSIEIAAVGQQLVGDKGFKCIECHVFDGHPSLGQPGPDLADTHERLRAGWFTSLVLDPQAVNPGTHMPAFLATDQPVFPDLLEGDPQQQADAIWSYLSLGASMPLPSGVVVDASEYRLDPVDDPILFGVFMEGVSPRTIAVGFPERTHVAWDSESARMAMAWRGDFMNARGTWHQRAGALERPEGEDVLELPPGPAITALATSMSPWPEAGGISEGNRRDEDRIPIFMSRQGDLAIEERARPYLWAGGSRLVRSFQVRSTQHISGLRLRAALGTRIDDAGEGQWLVDDHVRITSRNVEGAVRIAEGWQELLLPIRMLKNDDGTWSGVVEVEVLW